jgi:ATP/maltotriose-dependent transcriptional regulator MalT
VALEEAEAYSRRMLETARRMGARRAQALATCLLGESLLLRGRWDDAERCLTESLELHRDVGSLMGEGVCAERLGELAVFRGEGDRAVAHLQRGLETAEEHPMAPHLTSRIYATLALNGLEHDDPEAALEAIEDAHQAISRHGPCASCDALLLPVAAETFTLLGDRERARQQAAAAEDLRGWGSEAWLVIADVTQAFADGLDPQERAVRLLAAADRYERIDQPFPAARCRLQAGVHLASQGDFDQGP